MLADLPVPGAPKTSKILPFVFFKRFIALQSSRNESVSRKYSLSRDERTLRFTITIIWWDVVIGIFDSAADKFTYLPLN